MEILLISLVSILTGIFIGTYIVLCVSMGKIAEEKGYKGQWKKYAILCFFMNIFGYLYVIALPRKDESTKDNELDLYIETFTDEDEESKEQNDNNVINESKNNIEETLEVEIDDDEESKEDEKEIEDEDEDEDDNKVEETLERVEEFFESEMKKTSENNEEETKAPREKSSILVVSIIMGTLMILAIAVIAIDMAQSAL